MKAVLFAVGLLISIIDTSTGRSLGRRRRAFTSYLEPDHPVTASFSTPASTEILELAVTSSTPVGSEEDTQVFVGRIVNLSSILPSFSKNMSATVIYSKPSLYSLHTPKEVVNNISDSFSKAVGTVVNPVVAYLVNVSDAVHRSVTDLKSSVHQAADASLTRVFDLAQALRDSKFAVVNKTLLSLALPTGIPVFIINPPDAPIVAVQAQSAGGIASSSNVIVNAGNGSVYGAQGNVVIGTLVPGVPEAPDSPPDSTVGVITASNKPSIPFTSVVTASSKPPKPFIPVTTPSSRPPRPSISAFLPAFADLPADAPRAMV